MQRNTKPHKLFSWARYIYLRLRELAHQGPWRKGGPIPELASHCSLASSSDELTQLCQLKIRNISRFINWSRRTLLLPLGALALLDHRSPKQA
jgi:hypothetical protein